LYEVAPLAVAPVNGSFPCQVCMAVPVNGLKALFVCWACPVSGLKLVERLVNAPVKAL
jgi:hypothetical protein